VLPLLAVSPQECIDALRLAGFSVVERSERSTVLRRDRREVEVFDADLIDAEELEALLKNAGLPYTEFLELLSRTPTQPDLEVASTGMRPRVRLGETG
jgi:hypothetical protein